MLRPPFSIINNGQSFLPFVAARLCLSRIFAMILSVSHVGLVV